MRQQERRTEHRIKETLRVLIHDPEDALQQPYVGWILDRSQGGLCLAFRRAGVKRDDIFAVRLSQGAGKQPWFAVRVKHGRWRNSFLELGCQYVQGLGWPVTINGR
jgi:hypothetical protein